MNVKVFEKTFINFLIGGTIIASVSYLSTYFNPLIGAIVWSYPLSILPSIYYMKNAGKTNQYVSKFLLSTTFGLILLFLTTLLLSIFTKKAKDGSLIKPVLMATFWWFIMSIIFYFIIKFSGYEKYFM